jgi:uncharacterized membrane protein (DUF2068 family)
MKRPAGLQAIIAYKLTKAVAQAALGGAAVWLLASGRAEASVATLAEFVLEHFAGAGALRVATILVRAGTSKHLEMLAIALLADAVLSSVEGLALRAGKWWAPWLVVIATATLLPWELWRIFRHPRWGRVAVLVINIAVVLYLLRQVAREHREMVEHRRA